MGYRSQVVYAIEPNLTIVKNEEKAKDTWTMFIAEAKAKLETQQAMSMILDDCKDIEHPYWKGGLDSENHSILIEFDDVKWYDTFDEVISFNALIDLAESYEDEAIDAAYIRIGEDEGDVETRYINDGYELVRAYSYYDIEGSRFNSKNVDTSRQDKFTSKDFLKEGEKL